ncbi:MAG: hypothetical protein KDA42_06230 [Planctomycetales bacterium]|nr:hypothetical protein [Planctomycetales bacterium]
MSPQEVKTAYADCDWNEDDDRRERLSLRFAKRIKPVSAKTKFTTNARYARRSNKTASSASCRRSNRWSH